MNFDRDPILHIKNFENIYFPVTDENTFCFLSGIFDKQREKKFFK